MASNQEQLRDVIREALPGKTDDELSQMEKDGTLLDALKTQRQSKQDLSGFTRGIKMYGTKGLDPLQIRGSVGVIPRLMETQLQTQALQKRTGQEVTVPSLPELAEAPHKGVKGGFMWFLEQLDRPQDAMFSIIDSVVAGEKDWDKIWARANRNLKGQEMTYFADILDRMPNETKETFVDITEGLDKFWHLVRGKDTSDKEKVTWDHARRVFGFAGDMTIDPLMILGGVGKGLGVAGKAATATKGLRGLGKGLQAASVAVDPVAGAGKLSGAAMRVTGKQLMAHEGFKKFAHHTFLRGTGFKDLDKFLGKLPGYRAFQERRLISRGRDIYGKIKDLDKKGYPFTHLAEERQPLEEIVKLAEVYRGGGKADEVIEFTFANFSNPEAAKRTAKLLAENPDDLAALRTGVDDIREYFADIVDLRKEHGQRVTALGESQQDQILKLNKQKTRIIREAFEKARHAQRKKVRDLNIALRASKDKQTMLGMGMGFVRHAGPDALLKESGMAIDPAAFRKALVPKMQEMLTEVSEEITKNESALRHWESMSDMQSLRLVAEESKAYKDILEKIAKAEEVFEKTPNYMHHMLTEDALRAVSKTQGIHWDKVGGKQPGKRSPVRGEDIRRKFVDNDGRPLSLEEIQKIINDGGYYTGVIYKSPTVGGKIKKVFGFGNKKELRETADFFETDIATILAAQSQSTAKSVSASDYILKASKVFGKTDDQIEKLVKTGEMSKETANGYVTLDKIGGVSGILGKHPELAQVRFKPGVANAMVKSLNPVFSDPYGSPILKLVNAQKRWWINYTLPLYPAYHVRNKMGNILNMTHSGYLMDPRYLKDDITDSIKAHHVQMLLQNNKLEDARKIKFLLKDGTEINGFDIVESALKHGAIDTGFWSSEVGSLLKKGAHKAQWKKVGTSDWTPVKYGQEVGKYIENTDRLTLFASRLRRGDSMFDAAKATKKYLGDFTDVTLTPLERAASTVMPFYRWSRFNIPLQAEQILFNPMARHRMTNLRRIHEEFVEPEETQHGALPEWSSEFVRELGSVPTKFNRETGEMEFFALEGWITAADLDNVLGVIDSHNALLRFGMQSLAPPVKMAAEFAFDRPIFGEGRQFEGREQEFFGQRIPSRIVHVLRNLRFLAELDRLDPFAPFVGENSLLRFRKERDSYTTMQKIRRSILGLGTYKAKPMTEITKYRYDQLEKLRIERSRVLHKMLEIDEEMKKRMAEEDK